MQQVSSEPLVSVVMSVFNNAHGLNTTLDSILNQVGLAFEFIVVDDGSDDGTAAILQDYALQDQRLRIISQENRGLTQALIKGCEQAIGAFIARQDAGDISAPGRLLKQARFLESHPDVVLVSCGTLFTAPGGEHLYTVNHDIMRMAQDITDGDPRQLRGPSHHGSTMFRRNVYQQVGGYRPHFFLAQDLDLWVRLTEKGRHVAISEILYEARFSPDSLTGRYQREQVKLKCYIMAAADARRRSLDENEILEQAASIRPSRQTRSTGLRRACALYFIGACLRHTNPQSARDYFRQAIQAFPLHLRAWYRLLSL